MALFKFRNASGKKRIIISLAFNPEVRKTRIDYSGKEMRFELIRGKTIQEVSDVFSTQAGKSDEEKLAMVEGKYKCNMEPGIKLRSKGTLQQAIFSFTSAKEAEKYGDNYYLVVSCKRNWSSIKQKYAVAVVLETDDNVQLYTVKVKLEYLKEGELDSSNEMCLGPYFDIIIFKYAIQHMAG